MIEFSVNVSPSSLGLLSLNSDVEYVLMYFGIKSLISLYFPLLLVPISNFEIINKDLIAIFTKNNIKPIDCLNKKLDPNLHQAMMEIEDDQKEPGTIVQEVQKGFMIKDRLLRPSLVGVSKKTEIKDDKSEENKENLDK